MKLFEWAGYQVEVDENATHAWYAEQGRYNCPCGHCRNFMAQLDSLPREMLDILAEAGVPADRVVYVCELFHEGDRLYYEVEVPLAGRIVHKGNGEEQRPWGSIICHEDMPYPRPKRGLPEPHFDLQFLLWLPWVLDEPIDG